MPDGLDLAGLLASLGATSASLDQGADARRDGSLPGPGGRVEAGTAGAGGSHHVPPPLRELHSDQEKGSLLSSDGSPRSAVGPAVAENGSHSAGMGPSHTTGSVRSPETRVLTGGDTTSSVLEVSLEELEARILAGVEDSEEAGSDRIFHGIDLEREPEIDFEPTTKQEMAWCLASPRWRICSGKLYKIMVKKSDGEEGSLIPFRPNEAQVKLIGRLWYRNVILKARQLGFTTLIAILWLDHALFNENQRCGIIAQDKEAAEVIFRDKVKLAYDNLPEPLKMSMPLRRDSAQELLFDHNNSSIRVATSMRSGTIHRLHVSEFGKIGAEYPAKAQEVVTGSLPAVPLDGIAIIESTAQGQDGEFYKMTMKALDLMEQGKRLTARNYRLHFFPWFEDPDYRLDDEDAKHTVITDEEHLYFDQVQDQVGVSLSLGQRAWYVATRDSDFSGDPEKMWQEYPSTPKEAFQQSMEGHYYSVQLTIARKEGRITDVPHVDGYPVNTFWDIGGGDGTGIWLHQRIGLADRFIGYIEDWDKPYSHYIAALQAKGYVWGLHHLPHDADNKKQQGDKIESALDQLEQLDLGGTWVVVPRVEDLQNGIQMTRSAFSTSWFDQTQCKSGLIHLAGYKKKWNRTTGAWSDEPVKNVHREAADAYRQFAQSNFDIETGERRKKRKTPKNWKTR